MCQSYMLDYYLFKSHDELQKYNVSLLHDLLEENSCEAGVLRNMKIVKLIEASKSFTPALRDQLFLSVCFK